MLNLAMSHALATDGEKLTELSVRFEELRGEVDRMEKGVTEAQSIETILSGAERLGFAGLAKQKIINMPRLADSANVRLEK